MARAKKSAAKNVSAILAGAAAVTLAASAAHATDYVWSAGGGTQSWNAAANWTPNTGFPNLAGDGADFNVALGANLNVDLNQQITVGALKLGGTAVTPRTTNIGNGSTANVLIFDNTGGANNSDGNANASILSAGVAGSVNTISAPISLTSATGSSNTSIVAASTRNLTLGSLRLDANTATGAGATRQIVNNNTAGELIIGDITATATGAAPTANIVNILQIGHANNTTTTPWGTVRLNGVISNGATIGGFSVNPQILFGAAGANNANTIGTIIVSGNNTFSGGARLFRANVVLDNDNAFGTGSVQWGGGAAAGAMGFNTASTSDTRTIANTTTMQRNWTINGSNSLTWAGTISQSNASSLFSLLPAGKAFYITNNLATDTSGTGRTFTFDGTGATNVSGNIIDNTANTGTTGVVQKNGTGVVTVSSAASTYKGSTVGNGGLLEFTSATGYGASSAVVINPGGAIGVDTGTTAPAFTTLITAAALAPSRGSLALAPADAAVNIDYTAGDFAHANVVGTSLGAVAAGTTYTGTITPAAAGYRLGGGGTLTLAAANKLTGARNLTATNGGTVALTNTNNFTGNTLIEGNWIVTNQQAAALNNGATTGTGAFVPPGVNQATTLSVTRLSNGASSIGNPTDTTAGNLTINGGVLKYVGTTSDSTNRLFTVGPVGATLDSSGTGTVTFSNAGANVSADVAGHHHRQHHHQRHQHHRRLRRVAARRRHDGVRRQPAGQHDDHGHPPERRVHRRQCPGADVCRDHQHQTPPSPRPARPSPLARRTAT
jgi:hypothetical protein